MVPGGRPHRDGDAFRLQRNQCPRQKAPPMIMLLGRRDEPTDAVRDYANCLSEALRRQGIVCETSEGSWHERGWLVALANLWRKSRGWRGRWVVLHYTALMWSHRGFPLGVPFVLKIL